MKFKKGIKLIWQELLVGFKKRLFFICLIAVVGSMISAVVPYIYGRLVDIALLPDGSIWLIFSLISIWFLLSIVENWTSRRVNSQGELFSADLTCNFSHKIIGHILDLPMKFHDEERKGQLIDQISRADQHLWAIIQGNFFYLLPNFFTLVIALIFLASLNTILFLLLILVLLFYGYISVLKTKPISKAQNKLDKVWERAYGNFYEAVMNIDVVKNNAREEYEKNRFKQGIGKLLSVYSDFLKI